MSSKDYTLVARAYYLANLYNDTNKALAKTQQSDSWAIKVSNAIAKHDYKNVKSQIEEGVEKYSENSYPEDYKRAVDNYLKLDDSSNKLMYDLFSKAKGKNKDYIWTLKCENQHQLNSTLVIEIYTITTLKEITLKTHSLTYF